MHHQSLYAKIDYILCLAECQILPETFWVMECVVKVEIIQKLVDTKDSQTCITFMKVYYIYIYCGMEISNNNIHLWKFRNVCEKWYQYIFLSGIQLKHFYLSSILRQKLFKSNDFRNNLYTEQCIDKLMLNFVSIL